MDGKDGVVRVSRTEQRPEERIVARPEQLFQPATRRGFLRALGMGGSIVMLPSMFAACDDGSDPMGPVDGSVVLDLSNDVGILNYAFALEQLEAAFYSAVLGSAAFGGMTAEQKEVFADLRNHEVIHREFLRRALGSSAIPDLALNQSTAEAAVASTEVILRNAEAFEDLGVAAYNGAGKYLSSADYLLLAGKIVSVEARHAAAIRDLREAAGVTAGAAAGTRFAGDDVVIPSGAYAGLDVKLEPRAVLGAVGETGLVSTGISLGTEPAGDGTPDFAPPSATS